MDKRDILDCIIQSYTNGNKRKFATMLGITPQAITGWYARNVLDADLIINKLSDINARFLLTGEGEVRVSNQQVPAESNSSLIDIIRAQAEEIGRLKEILRTSKI